MAERSVVWTAIANFGSITRSARQARKEIEALKKAGEEQGAASTQSAQQQAAANKQATDAQNQNTQSGNRLGNALRTVIQARRENKAATDAETASTQRATTATNELSAAQNTAAASTTNLSRRLDQGTRASDAHDASLRRSGASHRRFSADVGGTSRVLNAFRSALSSVTGGASTSVFDRIRSSLRGMDEETRRSTSSMVILQSAVNSFRGDNLLSFLGRVTVSRVPIRLQLMGSAAIIAADAIGALGGAMAGLGTGLASMAGTLGPIIGLLATLPGLAVAATGAFGSLLGSLSGVGGAMKAFDQQQKASARTSGTSAQRTLDNNKKIASSERNLAAQRRASARAIRDAEIGIRDARERAARTQVDSARQIADAEESVIDAMERVADAERSLVRAQKATNDARIDAAKRLRDLERQTKSYALSEESAALSLEEARKRLVETLNDPGSTDLDRRAADLAVREAEARLEDVRYASAEHDAELADARKKGIEGSDQVVSALESEQDAHRAIADAKESVGDAEESLARTREDAARSIRDANEAVARAEENLAEAHLRAAEQMENANDAMERAASAAIPAAAGANAFAEAMAKLTPEAQAVVWQLIRMRDGWNEVRQAAERAVLPGVLVFLQSVEKLFPTITQFASDAGAEVGKLFADFGRLISSDTAIDKWNIVLADAVEIIANWRIGLMNVAQVIGDIAVAAANSGLNDWLGEITVGWTEAWKAWTSGEEGARRLDDFFQKTMRNAELIGSVIAGMVGFFYNVGRVGSDAGIAIWTSFDKALKTFNDWSKTKDGFESIKAVADASVPLFRELGLLIVDLAKGMGELFVYGDPGALTKQLREEFLPVLIEIFKVLHDTGVIKAFVSALSSIGASLVESGTLELLGELIKSILEFAVYALPVLFPVINVFIKILTKVASTLAFAFRHMEEGTVIGYAFGVALAALGTALAAVAFGTFLTRVRSFFTSFAAGVRNFLNLVDKVIDGVQKISGGGLQTKPDQPTRAVAATKAPKLDSSDAERAAKRSGLEVMREYFEGLLQGAKLYANRLRGAGKDLGEDLVDGTEDELGISSPSRKGLQIGRNFGDSVADGARDEKRNVRRAGDELGDELGDGAESGVRRRGPGLKNAVGAIFQVAATAAITAGAALVALGVSSINAYGDLQQTVRKTTQLFGDGSRAMQDWATKAIDTMGMSRVEALNLANNFGTLFLQLGYTQEQAMGLSQEFSTLAAGLALANPGVEAIDAFHALEAAFAGDYTELAKLNPALDESAVLQKALEMTGKDATSALTEQEKQAALLALAQDEATKSSKDLADQQESTKGAIDRIQARWQNFREDLGKKLDTQLKPVADDLDRLLSDPATIEAFSTALTGLADALVKVTKALSEAITETEKRNKTGDTVTTADEEVGRQETNRLTNERAKEIQKLNREQIIERGRKAGVPETAAMYPQVVARAEVSREIEARKETRGTEKEIKASGSASASTKSQPTQVTADPTTVKQQGTEIGKALPEGAKQGMEEEGPGFWSFIGQWIDKYIIEPVKRFLGISSPSTLFAGFGADLVNGLVLGFQNFWGNFGTLFSELWNGFLTLLGNGLTWVQTMWGIAWTHVGTFFSTIWNSISGFFSGIWTGFQTLLGSGLTWISTTWSTVWNAISLFFSTIWNALVSFFSGIWSGLQGLFNQGLEFIKGIWNTAWNWIKTTAENIWNSVRAGVDSFFSAIRSAFQTGVDAIGRIWDGIKEKTREPVKFVIDTVYTGGIKKMWDAVAGLVGLGKAPDVTFADGGWTGPGSKYKPAGVVHADEYVVNKASRRKLENKNPGLLDYINETGKLPNKYVNDETKKTLGYRDGGHVGEGSEGPGVNPGFADRVLFKSPEQLTPEGHIPFMGGAHPLQSLFAALFMGGAAPVPGGRVTNFHGANGAYHGTRWAGDMAMPGGTPVYAWKAGTVAHTQRLAGSYGWNIILNHADGSSSRYAHLSAFAVSPGQQVAQGQRIGSVGTTGNSTGNHLHFEVMGGNAPLNMSGISASGSAVAAPTAFDQMKDLITDPVASMKEKFGDSPWVDMISKIPTTLADKAKSFLDEKLSAIVDAIPFVPGGSGSVPGLAGVTANTYAKAANIYAAATGAGHRISTVGGYRSDYEHNTRRALDFMVGLSAAGKAAGDFISSYVLSNRAKLDLMHVIWYQRINSGSGWRGMSNRGSATQNHLDHPHVKFGRADAAIGGYARGGQVGFALEVGTPILTQNRGWVKHGDLAVGDYVYDECGSPTMITQVRHWVDRPSYVVKFSDGAEIIADENHLWQVRDCRLTYQKKADVRVVNTKWMSENLKLNSAGANRLAVDLGDGFEGTHRDFRIDPYVLGYWLGDGTSSRARIRVEGKDLEDLEKNLTACGETFRTSQTPNTDYYMVQIWGKNVPESSWKVGTKHVDAFSNRLKEYNLLNNKHIPEDYMLASFDQRLALLQGLMDSDGNISKKQGLCEWAQSGRLELSLQVLELAWGLGIKATLSTYPAKVGDDNYNRDARYLVRFTTDTPVFRMERKADSLQEHVNKRRTTKSYTRRHIIDVVPVGNFDTNCITVDSPNHLYLAGEHFIPTHNSPYDGGGWTGYGPRMQPAGIVHADEYVISKPSRRSFEYKHPGVLDYINKTGQLPAAAGYAGYHKGGPVKTGVGYNGSKGTWWSHGPRSTLPEDTQWIGALRNILGLDDWDKGWDDDLDKAFRKYDGEGPASVDFGPWWDVMHALRSLPASEFTGGVPEVAKKIGVHQDTIFRMMSTSLGYFQQQLGNGTKWSALEPSFAWFRNFNSESIRELQGMMGIEQTGSWNENMRRTLLHIRYHATGTDHWDSDPVGDNWSMVGEWGGAFNEIFRTIQLNEEWDKMIDQFFVWGYDSLIRHLEEKGVAEGMELARDLYHNPFPNARDADVWFRRHYEREDAIKDENSELNRLRRLVNYLRRYDEVGLQGLSSYLELTMDTTAMLYKKAKDKDMLSGISLSKTHRLDKDVVEFDELFRFAMGGMVPGRGNIDSVLALLTPGEYVLTRDETRALMRAQDMIAKYRGPSISNDIPGMMSSASAMTNIVNNTTNNVNATIISPEPELAGVAFQKHMKNLADNGMFGVDDG